MTIAQRAASRRGVAAVVASLALAAGLVGSFAAPSSAEDPSTGEYGGFSAQRGVIKGHLPGADTSYTTAGLLNLRIDDSEDVLVYCVDTADGIDEGDTIPEAPWDGSSIANRDAVERILNSYHPIGVGPEGYEIEGTDSEKAEATQAAIWHFTNGYELENGDGSEGPLSVGYPTVFANYQTILKAVADGVLPALGGPVTLTIEGDTDVDAIPGQLIGPFTIHTSVASVELTVSGGTLHNEDGSPFEGPASDGDEVWLKASEAGTVSLSGVAAGVQSGVRLFAAEDLQDLAFLVVTPQEVPARIEVTVHTPPTTSTSTTSTTEQATTTTSITPQSSVSTTSIVPQQGEGGLPVTGAPTLALVALALVLLAAGVGFGVVSRRRRDQAA